MGQHRGQGDLCVIGWAAILTLCLIPSCARKKPVPPSSPEGQATGALLSESATPPILYPHPEGWKEAASHGLKAFEGGREPCLKCHNAGSDHNGGAPGCQSCHPLYPHAESWVKPEVHGAKVFEEGKASCATQCHGPDLQGGLSKIACADCHSLYPHTATWAKPEEHGTAFRQKPKKVCQSCHGDDLRGGSSKIGCRKCHAAYPHVARWGEEERHGLHVLQNGPEGCTTQCHGADLKGGLSGISCNRCHDIYPHGASWDKEHGKEAIALGLAVCKNCHGDDLKTLVDGKTCFSCHQDYPHPEAATWIPYQSGHGRVVQETYKRSLASCQFCHGTDLKDILGDRNCYSCHPSFPHPAEWKEFEGHGQYTLSHTKTECQVCHGADLQGGNRGNDSCFSCHPPYPHIEGWRQARGRPQPHGDFVQAQTSTSCAKAYCHGENLTPTPGITQGLSCRDCHQTYPHAPDWRSGAVHGPLARQEISNCKTCHGAGLDKAPPGFLTCKNCHESYLRHESAKIDATDWGDFSGHATYFLNRYRPGERTECQFCHGADYTGGLSRVGCTTSACHQNYPHKIPDVDREWGQGDEHGAFVQHDGIASCAKASCHGINLIPQPDVTLGSPCQECHTRNFPHPADWRDGTHGPAALADIDSCKSCHGAGLDKAPRGRSSCRDCHLTFLLHEQAQTGATGWRQASGHRAYMLDPSNADALTECGLCHETGGRGGTGNPVCRSCHMTNPHTPGWGGAGAHAASFVAAGWNSRSTEADCWLCHGSPIGFDATQTRATLPSASLCYTCHPAYPHTAWLGSPWGPIPSTTCGARNINHFTTHYSYLYGGEPNSPIFIDRAGNHPTSRTTPNGDPLWANAVSYTCGGGTAGSCHFDGNRTFYTGMDFGPCGISCHNAARGYPPDLDDCEPPPVSQVDPGNPPRITGSTPARTEGGTTTGVARDISPSVTFNEAMRGSTVTTPGTFVLRKVSDGTPILTQPDCIESYCRRAQWDPQSFLQYDTEYEATVTTAARDWDGTPMTAPFTWRFRTAVQDRTPPTVASTEPPNGASDVDPEKLIRITFSEEMNRQTITTSSINVRPTGGGTAITGTVGCDTPCRTATFNPDDRTRCSGSGRRRRCYPIPSLDEGANYTVTTSSSVQDLAGNLMAAPYTFTFTTGYQSSDDEDL